MLLKRYGSHVHSVVPHFDARAMTEIRFRRDGVFRIPAEVFEAEYVRVGGHELTAEAEGAVQDEAERVLLERLEAEVVRIRDGLGEGEVLLIEGGEAGDWPRTRDRKEEVVVAGRNRLYFRWRVEPPLRVGVYRRG